MSLGMYSKRRVEFVRMRGPNVRKCLKKKLRDIKLDDEYT
jgi:hypothetical protein